MLVRATVAAEIQTPLRVGSAVISHVPSFWRIDSLGIDRLSVRDRLDLIEQIWDSLPEQVEPLDIPDWHVAELTTRCGRAAESPGVGKPWRQVLERLEGGS